MVKCETVADYEELAWSRMSGEDIANELTDEEAKDYYRLVEEL